MATKKATELRDGWYLACHADADGWDAFKLQDGRVCDWVDYSAGLSARQGNPEYDKVCAKGQELWLADYRYPEEIEGPQHKALLKAYDDLLDPETAEVSFFWMDI